MALSVLKEISEYIRDARFFTIMADETSGISYTEKLVICINWVSEDFVAHEDFICLSPLKRTTAYEIFSTLVDALQLMKLKLGDARGQCYDGAATMSGKKNGVATQIKNMNGKCLFPHCYGHALYLAIGNTIKFYLKVSRVKSMKKR